MLPVLLPLLLSPAQDLAAAPFAEPTPTGTRLVDLDGDGQRDLLTFHADGALLVRQGAGPRRFVDVPQELPRVQVTDLVCSDLDGDGQLDLYLVSPAADVALLGLGGGRFREATGELGLLEAGLGRSAERLDLDGDGLLDLLVHNQGSDVLFWARPDGRFEREERTLDGVAPTLFVPVLPTEVARPGSLAGPTGSTVSPGAGAPGTSPLTASPTAGPVSPGSAPLMGISFDARYVNDNQNEVDSADIVDGSLTGADVSTSGGNVTFGGSATVTAEKGVFGIGSISGSGATVSGGNANTALGTLSTVAGGSGNTALGLASMVAGGGLNDALGDFGFAAGFRAKANHNGAFVWGDSVNVDKTSSDFDEFNVYAEGGARVFADGQTTPSLVVDPDGKVGIGTASPSVRMQVEGPNDPFSGPVLRLAGAAQNQAESGRIRLTESTGFAGTYIRYDGAQDRMFIGGNSAGGSNPASDVDHVTIMRNTGDVGLGVTNPAFKLEVNGSAGKPGGGSWSVSSDRRLKRNVHDLEGALDTLLALRGVTFEYKDPGAIHELPGERIGFIAQEVEQVLPDWVEEAGGYKRLTIRGFEALAVESLRQLRTENDELRERVARLESLEGELRASVPRARRSSRAAEPTVSPAPFAAARSGRSRGGRRRVTAGLAPYPRAAREPGPQRPGSTAAARRPSADRRSGRRRGARTPPVPAGPRAAARRASGPGQSGRRARAHAPGRPRTVRACRPSGPGWCARPRCPRSRAARRAPGFASPEISAQLRQIARSRRSRGLSRADESGAWFIHVSISEVREKPRMR